MASPPWLAYDVAWSNSDKLTTECMLWVWVETKESTFHEKLFLHFRWIVDATITNTSQTWKPLSSSVLQWPFCRESTMREGKGAIVWKKASSCRSICKQNSPGFAIFSFSISSCKRSIRFMIRIMFPCSAWIAFGTLVTSTKSPKEIPSYETDIRYSKNAGELYLQKRKFSFPFQYSFSVGWDREPETLWLIQ